MFDPCNDQLRRLSAQELAKLRDERNFWDEAVLSCEPESESQAKRAVRIADFLLEARKERFDAAF
jgi:hypothetical protein